MKEQLASFPITKDFLYREVRVPLVHPSRQDAATVLGIGASRAYRLARSGELPTIRLGRRWWVTTAVLRQMLGMDEDEATPKDAA